MEIKITINAPELSEAINKLAEALNGMPAVYIPNSISEDDVSMCMAESYDLFTQKQETATAVAVEPQPEPTPIVTTVPTVPVAPAVPVAPPQPAEPQYTMDMIARAGTALVDAGKMNEVIALLGKYGVSVLTDLDPSKYSDIANDLRALGASI